MIRVGRRLERPDLGCYRKKVQSGLKRFGYAYKGEVRTDAEYEEKVARDHYDNDANYEIKDGERQLTKKGKKFEFWVYSREEIRDALRKEFRGKCAYCEYEIGVRTDFDIEHFRPKKAVKHSKTKELLEPGYYWLAAKWHNLMPSCQFCNQARKQEVTGETGKTTLGKKNQFPLSDESKRVRSPDEDIADEEAYRLLVNPSTERPEDHLHFVTHGDEKELGLVEAAKHAGEPDEKGNSSMLVYALNTKLLVDTRHEHLSETIKLLQRLEDRAKKYHKAESKGEASAEDLWEILEETSADLCKKLEPKAMFLGMARQLVRDFDAAGSFATLKQYGIDPMKMVAASEEATEKVDP